MKQIKMIFYYAINVIILYNILGPLYIIPKPLEGIHEKFTYTNLNENYQPI